MLLGQIKQVGNPQSDGTGTNTLERIPGQLAGGERELGVDAGFGCGVAVRAAGAARLGASAERLVNDALDGARASPAFGGATETAIDLLGISRQIFRGADSAADIVVGQNVAGTNNHEKTAGLMVIRAPSILKAATGCKRKNAVLK
jgi:hypothetical protein